MFSTSSQGRRALTFRADMLDVKATRSTQGVQVVVLRGKAYRDTCTAGTGRGIQRPQTVFDPYHSFHWCGFEGRGFTQSANDIFLNQKIPQISAILSEGFL